MTPHRVRRLGLSLVLVGITACGGRPPVTEALRAQLSAAGGEELREQVPDLVASVESALDDADSAQRRGDDDAAADHVTRARLLLDAARVDLEGIRDRAQAREADRAAEQALATARRDERASEELYARQRREAASRTAREEALRALERAEEDESRPRRRRRVSLEEASDVRRATSALGDRARAVLAAAVALGAGAEAVGATMEALGSIESATSPEEALAAADRAHHLALRALGDARAGRDEVGRDAVRVLAEAARGEGFAPISLSEGLAVEARGMFAAGRNTLTPSGRARARRLASLAAAHPFGPIHVRIEVARSSGSVARLAARRATVLLEALAAEGVPRERLEAHGTPSSLASDVPADTSRLVFLAYVP